MTKNQKALIDNMSYSEMLYRQRFAPIGDPLFSGESGEYFAKKMAEKKAALKPGEAAAISKRVGWD